jgi:outer membrane lipoprotein
MNYNIPKSGFTLLIALLLSSCASQVPLNIREAPADSPSLAQVREKTADYEGQQVRWGGTIIETVNRENATWLTVLGRPLYKDGKPEFTDDSAGRFIAIVPEFLDPKVYAADRRVTVTGTVARTEAGMVGEHPYSYPVVQADGWYLWPKEVIRPYGYDPWYDDPWYLDRWHYPPSWYYRGYPYAYPYRNWY